MVHVGLHSFVLWRNSKQLIINQRYDLSFKMSFLNGGDGGGKLFVAWANMSYRNILQHVIKLEFDYFLYIFLNLSGDSQNL